MTRLPHPRFLLFLAVFGVGTALLSGSLALPMALIGGFDAAATVFVASALPLWLDGGPAAMRSGAARDDGGRRLLPVAATIVLAVLLVALGQMIGGSDGLHPTGVALVLATLVLAWGFVNLVYAFHYAHLYYDRDDGGTDRGGLDFPGDTEPVFSDFVYFAFTLGMTFQVSDVVIRNPVLRRTATVHAVLGFLFNLGAVALTINVLAGVL